jgi:hypothetical protein
VEDEFRQQLLEQLKAIEQRLDALDASQRQLKEASPHGTIRLHESSISTCSPSL